MCTTVGNVWDFHLFQINSKYSIFSENTPLVHVFLINSVQHFLRESDLVSHNMSICTEDTHAVDICGIYYVK